MSDAVYNTMKKNKWRKLYYISGLYSSNSDFYFFFHYFSMQYFTTKNVFTITFKYKE